MAFHGRLLCDVTKMPRLLCMTDSILRLKDTASDIRHPIGSLNMGHQFFLRVSMTTGRSEASTPEGLNDGMRRAAAHGNDRDR
jgi:hypothetical protein